MGIRLDVVAVTIVLGAISGWRTGLGAAEPALTQAELMGRAAAYLDEYDQRFSAVISQEDYSQTETRLDSYTGQEHTRGRAMKSQLLLLNAGQETWLCFRDVFEVDGKLLPDHVERFTRLLATAPAESAGAGSLAVQITAESARYNLGQVTRNFNVPTAALAFLRRSNQQRSAFHEGGTQKTSQGVEAHVVSFSEKQHPTIIRSEDDHDVPALGRFWIESSGRVDRTELSLRTDHGVNATITVEYGSVPKLQTAVPLSMHEHYDQYPFDKIEAFATYSAFSVPEVRVDVMGFKQAVERTGRGGGR